ncbi:MAG: glycosyltransferase [Acidobacteriaceae bacterium]|nr:glycosyltransferase [Acidobacteriaceae bacterium]
MARTVLNTFGSFGDLHPYLALALGLKARGHHPVIATSAVYAKKVEAEGIGFAPVRPDVGELLDRPEFVKKLWHPRRGSEYLIRDYLIPRVREGFADLREACRGADLLVTHAAAYPGPIVGELLRIPWISVALQPAVMFSVSDPFVIPAIPWVRHLYPLGPGVFRSLMWMAKTSMKGWIRPIQELRREIGLPTTNKNPIMQGQFSPFGTLALFSKHFAQPQPDWPPRTTQTGFVFYDQLGEGMPGVRSDKRQQTEELRNFLGDGPPPVLFTLGSSAVMQAGGFFAESLDATRKLNIRAIMLTGNFGREQLPSPLPSSIFVTDYLPYSEIMPKAAVIVHQGGIGTTAQGLRAGRPALVVPWSHDQPDNAERLRKIGVGRTISRKRYRAQLVVEELKHLLNDKSYAERAQQIGSQIASEDGISCACDAIGAALRTA